MKTSSLSELQEHLTYLEEELSYITDDINHALDLIEKLTEEETND